MVADDGRDIYVTLGDGAVFGEVGHQTQNHIIAIKMLYKESILMLFMFSMFLTRGEHICYIL